MKYLLITCDKEWQAYLLDEYSSLGDSLHAAPFDSLAELIAAAQSMHWQQSAQHQTGEHDDAEPKKECDSE